MIIYDIKSEKLKQKCECCFNKIVEILGENSLLLFAGFKEDSELDNVAAYFTNDGLGYPAGFVVIRSEFIEDWVIIHELAHAMENSLFGSNFEIKCKYIINQLNENIYRESNFKYSERLADLIVENINNNKIKEIRKCLLEAIKD